MALVKMSDLRYVEEETQVVKKVKKETCHLKAQYPDLVCLMCSARVEVELIYKETDEEKMERDKVGKGKEVKKLEKDAGENFNPQYKLVEVEDPVLDEKKEQGKLEENPKEVPEVDLQKDDEVGENEEVEDDQEDGKKLADDKLKKEAAEGPRRRLKERRTLEKREAVNGELKKTIKKRKPGAKRIAARRTMTKRLESCKTIVKSIEGSIERRRNIAVVRVKVEPSENDSKQTQLALHTSEGSIVPWTVIFGILVFWPYYIFCIFLPCF